MPNFKESYLGRLVQIRTLTGKDYKFLVPVTRAIIRDPEGRILFVHDYPKHSQKGIAVKGRMAGAIMGALLGVGCAIFAWLTIAVQTGNAALAIIAIVGTLIIGGSMIVSSAIIDIQRKAIGRLNSRAVLTELLPTRALAIGIAAGGLVGVIAYLGTASVLETGCGLAIAILVGSAAFATLGAALGAPEKQPTMWRRGERRVGTFSHLIDQALIDQLVGNILVRDYGDDLDEREALKGEIVTRLQRLEFPLNLLSSLLEHQDWAVRYESASMLGHSHSVRAVKPLIEVMMKDQSTSVQRAASSALERIGSAEALAAVETWRLEKE